MHHNIEWTGQKSKSKQNNPSLPLSELSRLCFVYRLLNVVFFSFDFFFIYLQMDLIISFRQPVNKTNARKIFLSIFIKIQETTTSVSDGYEVIEDQLTCLF